MPAKSNRSQYGNVAVAIHWLSAFLIIALQGSGFRVGGTIDPGVKTVILRFHISAGVALLLLTLARIFWWCFVDRKPDSVSSASKLQSLGASLVHLLFYPVILGMIASGIGMLILSGAGNIIFAGTPGQLPDFQSYLPRIPHGIGARAFVVLILLHAGAALYHQFLKKDGTLKRMWFTK